MNIKIILKWFVEAMKWCTDNHAFILAVATLLLVLVTYHYLRETKKIRKIAEKSFELDSGPKVFLAEITPVPRLDNTKKSIYVTLVLKVKNVGRTEAKEINMDYIFSYEKDNNKKITVEGSIDSIQYIFPTQEVAKETKMLSLVLDDKNFSIVKAAKEQNKPVIPRKGLVPPIYFKLTLSYLNQNNERISCPYKYKYIFHENKLVDEN